MRRILCYFFPQISGTTTKENLCTQSAGLMVGLLPLATLALCCLLQSALAANMCSLDGHWVAVVDDNVHVELAAHSVNCTFTMATFTRSVDHDCRATARGYFEEAGAGVVRFLPGVCKMADTDCGFWKDLSVRDPQLCIYLKGTMTTRGLGLRAICLEKNGHNSVSLCCRTVRHSVGPPNYCSLLGSLQA